ncbi:MULTISPECIES: disulfide bond formation protein B [Sphingobium]|uniref:Disulfide bond formation protein n=2 Tax=Sphingobium cupriresistens TaxID=1132417 RepID=A0A0J7XS18_9SPHN|nr:MULTISPECIES: disulfide bond formation protein B [Sphingobium]KMS53853.1 disulfide bond formation protein [Sphingobium cupriresistens LL01]MBJ7378267.1 disulfide bond formation protein B [Sphingobium sp.]RYM10352.1 disulfide bond formation protein B [Sphingobium cupriresistens]WCP13199.1 Disulfide bond formation protein B [Sphingobium sp. AntQ-1]
MKSIPLARTIALLTPVLLLGGAYASQYIGGLHPCEMCWWQRYPHMAAIPLALIAYALRSRACVSALFAGLAGLAIGISGLIGLFHAGVEYGWWEGLTTCSTTPAGGADLLNQIWATPIVRCDVAPWDLLGISLAGYNGLLSGAAALAILALLLKARKA